VTLEVRRTPLLGRWVNKLSTDAPSCIGWHHILGGRLDPCSSVQGVRRII
jgi:hypothetical protein